MTLGGLWSYAKKEPSLYEEIPQDLAGSSLVSFRLGLCQLIEALAHELKSRIHFNEALKTLTWVPSKQKFHIKSSQLNLEADWVVLACSPWQLKEALHDLPAPWPQFQAAVGSQSLVLVSLAYSQAIDPSLGFGYLVPSSQREHVLGCVVDSNVFPEHNRGYPTRLTVMMDGSYLSGGFHRDQCLQLAQMALARHLKWHHHPKWQALSLAQDALPICRVGHLERLEVLRHTLQSRKMGLYFTGLGYGAQSLSQCALQAHSLARELQNDLESF